MITVVSEIFVNEENKEEYLKIAAELKPLLTDFEGFISIERFASLQDPNKLLSLSVWENEEALAKWRNNIIHRRAQSAALDRIYTDFRIRVGNVVRDYSLTDRKEAPADSNEFHEKITEKYI